jgi:hypothetical protein
MNQETDSPWLRKLGFWLTVGPFIGGSVSLGGFVIIQVIKALFGAKIHASSSVGVVLSVCNWFFAALGTLSVISGIFIVPVGVIILIVSSRKKKASNV